MDAVRQRLDRFLRLMPYLALAGATVFVVVTRDDPDLDRQPLGVSVAVAVVTACWILWFVTLHPRWEARRRLMGFFFAGLVALSAVLVWTNPLYGFSAWTGYLVLMYALDGRWQLLGAAGIGFCTAVSQMNGFGVFTRPEEYPALAVVLAFNIGIGMAMTLLGSLTNAAHHRRAAMVAQLAEANRKLEAALEENAGLHAQLLVQAREAGILDERQRLAGEIHDVLAQGLTGIVTQLEAAEQAADRPADQRRHLTAARHLARDSLTEARRSVYALRPRPLDAATLPDALVRIAADWSRRQRVAAELITTGTPRALLPEIEATLLRTAQEALANVARHAAAGRVALTLSYMEELVTLDVRDDGAGFDPAAPRERTDAGGYGLTAMRDRLHRVAGSLEIESEPGAGTAVSACVPAIPLGAAA
ncbi:sensor histidine kinase [Actinoplanes sp. RD1]|uniref:sensor histidine kinase n=1 Tax=Actinoplanes sp. RD1 TaxID=3064538 RepID=UPI0027426C0E|nr:sensor histidine kinase [Actinoplanes sp. RD1]